MKVNVLKIKREHLSEIRRLAVKSEIEICGLLLGRVAEGVAEVVEVKFLRNALMSPVEFATSPEEFIAAILEAESKGLDIVGLFHSHPAVPRPSTRDFEGMKLWPIPWLIVSMYDGEVGCFVLEGDSVKEIKVEVVD